MRATATDYITLIPEAPVLLISGRWDVNKEYTRDSEVLPLVEHEGLFYSLNKEGMTKGGLNPKDDYAKNGSKATWKLQNSYEMVIVKAIVAGGGLVGEFVFWDGKMMSQQGVDKAGNPSTKYEEFRAGNFIPNLILDAITGEIKAIRGQFGLLHIEDNDIIGTDKTSGEVFRITGDGIPNASAFDGHWTLYDIEAVNGLSEMFYYDTTIEPSNDTFRGTWYNTINCDKVGEYMIDDYDFVFSQINGIILKTSNPSTIATVTHKGRLVKKGVIGDINGFVFYADKKGGYDIKFECYMPFSTVRAGGSDRDFATVQVFSGYRGVSYKTSARMTTCIGSDGLYTSFSTEEFLHYKAGEGFILRAGNYGLRVSKNGIQKWNGSTWVTANI